MIFLSRSKALMHAAGPRPADQGPRARLTGTALLVELLEDRVLLSKGDDSFGALDHHGGVDSAVASLLKQQVVQVKVADLVADGLGSVVQGLPVQDGQVQAIRTGDVLQIGNAYFQYASGQGYPLVPVNGPSLSADVGVPRGAAPVLLPMTEPAPAMVSTPAAASPVAVATAPDAVSPAAAAPMPAATETVLPVVAGPEVASPISPALESSFETAAAIPAAVPSAQAGSVVPGTVAAAAPVIAASATDLVVPGTSSAAATVPVVPVGTSSPTETAAAVPAGSPSITIPSPSSSPVPASASVTSAASSAPATGSGSGSEHDGAPATLTASQTAAVAAVIAAGVSSLVAPTISSTPAPALAPAANGANLPAGHDLPPAAVASGDRTNQGEGGASDHADAPTAGGAEAEVPVATTSPAGEAESTAELDGGRLLRLNTAGGEIADTVGGDEAIAAPEVEDEAGEASEDAEMLRSLAPVIVGSIACLAWGNYLHSSNPAERRGDRESEEESEPASD